MLGSLSVGGNVEVTFNTGTDAINQVVTVGGHADHGQPRGRHSWSSASANADHRPRRLPRRSPATSPSATAASARRLHVLRRDERRGLLRLRPVPARRRHDQPGRDRPRWSPPRARRGQVHHDGTFAIYARRHRAARRDPGPHASPPATVTVLHQPDAAARSPQLSTPGPNRPSTMPFTTGAFQEQVQANGFDDQRGRHRHDRRRRHLHAPRRTAGSTSSIPTASLAINVPIDGMLTPVFGLTGSASFTSAAAAASSSRACRLNGVRSSTATASDHDSRHRGVDDSRGADRRPRLAVAEPERRPRRHQHAGLLRGALHRLQRHRHQPGERSPPSTVQLSGAAAAGVSITGDPAGRPDATTRASSSSRSPASSRRRTRRRPVQHGHRHVRRRLVRRQPRHRNAAS